MVYMQSSLRKVKLYVGIFANANKFFTTTTTATIASSSSNNQTSLSSLLSLEKCLFRKVASNSLILSFYPKRIIRNNSYLCNATNDIRNVTLRKFYRNDVEHHVAIVSFSSSSSSPLQENPFMKRSADASTTTTTATATAVVVDGQLQPDELSPIALDNTIRLKNAVMATSLLLFCFGVAYYSMHAVGQAGTSTVSSTTDGTTTTTSGDPLAVLKAEAAIAQAKINKEQETTATTVDMLEKFEKGEYDPDHISDEELDSMEEEERKKNKKSWWKFW